MPESFFVRFWGTRGSIPSPGPSTSKYGGNTSCVEVRAGDGIFICDAGTGIRGLGDTLLVERKGKPIEASIFITHTHWDHIQGFPFFVPAYIPGNHFRIHGPHGMGKSFESVFRGLMDPSYFPVDLGDMSSKIEFVEVTGEPMSYDGVEIRSTFTNHPGVDLAYRFNCGGKSAVYLTDHETYQTMNAVTEFARKQDKIIEDFCRGADLLICDAQYTEEEYRKKRTWGHSRFMDTVQLALGAGCRRLALFHHDPSHDDAALEAIAEQSRDIVKRSGKALEVLVAQEGRQVDL